jgi:tRNA(adenine34) deaminase
MRLALEQAACAAEQGEVPIGAVVVTQDSFNAASSALSAASTSAPAPLPHPVAVAGNRREQDCDPSAHAELLAIRAAAATLKRWRLADCTVYVTLEPCPMCAGLMYQARIKRCVFAAADPKAGAAGSLYDLHDDSRLNHRFAVTSGVLRDEAAALLTAFFRHLRKDDSHGRTRP